MISADLKRLLLIIEQQVDWGDAASWQSKDFEMLNELILEKTKISLSSSTLRRLWGKVEYNHLPSGTTLDTLAQFAGFESWRAFTRPNTPLEKSPTHLQGKVSAPQKKLALLLKITLLLVSAIGISLLSMHVKKTGAPLAGSSFTFSSRPTTRDIPNSVVFNYNVKVNPTDSVFIQQSWDPGTRVPVDKKLHQYTSVYYRPGFYHAKLEVNKKIVKERLLLIPTNGWLGLITHRPIPVYLSPKEFTNGHELTVPASVISQKNIPLQPQPPGVEYYNVGNFEPVPLKDLSFSTEIKNDYHEGAAACRFISIMLFTDYTPVIVQLSAPGCISDLRLLNGGYFVSGKNTDLSGFGADLSKWVKVSCRSSHGVLQYYVNDQLVYKSTLPLYQENVVGIGYYFQGTGSVRNIRLENGDKIAFGAFN